jgi:hypothetical protein
MSDKKKEPLSIQSSVDAPVTGGYIDTKRPDFSHRRRLIKASVAAVPTIMTLRSGVAIAATSMHCTNRDAAITDVPTITATDEDSWVRTVVYEFSSESLVAYKGNHKDIEALLALYEQDGMTDDEIVQAFCISQQTDVDSQTTTILSSETTVPDSETTTILDSETTTILDSETTTILDSETTTVTDSQLTDVNINDYIEATLTGPFLRVHNTENTYDWFVQTGMEPPSYQGIGQEGKHFVFCGDRGVGVAKYALCYVTFDENGHIDVNQIACFPDDQGGGQPITESCACSIDPNFQMGPT